MDRFRDDLRCDREEREDDETFALLLLPCSLLFVAGLLERVRDGGRGGGACGARMLLPFDDAIVIKCLGRTICEVSRNNGRALVVERI